VLTFTLIKFFYFRRYSLYRRCIFVSPISYLIIISVTRADSRAVSSRFIGPSRPKPSLLLLVSAPPASYLILAVVTSLQNAPVNSNSSDRIYIASSRRFFCQRCARRYITIPDRNFPLYFIPNRRVRCTYCANINKKCLTLRFYCLALSRCRADIKFTNYFLDFRFIRQFLR
jgi:hypothetical protein